MYCYAVVAAADADVDAAVVGESVAVLSAGLEESVGSQKYSLQLK